LQDEINLKDIVKEEYENTINELDEADREKKDKRLFYINMTHFMP